MNGGVLEWLKKIKCGSKVKLMKKMGKSYEQAVQGVAYKFSKDFTRDKVQFLR